MRRINWTILSGCGAVILGALWLPPSTRAAAPQEPAACLHGANESPEQLARRREAMGFTRHVNTVQRNSRGYLSKSELPLKLSVPEGFDFHLVADTKGYSFSVIDKTDPCRFGFFSNEAGVIFKGEVIR